MILDCFLFFNELDLLELRMTELDGVVDKFVICESTQTFQGDEKELLFLKNRGRFSKWDDKIWHVIHRPPKRECSAWDREAAQRNAIMSKLSFSPNDLLLLSDIDEIPHPGDLANATPPATFAGYMSYYWINCKLNRNWRGPKLYRVGDMKKSLSRLRYGKNPVGGRSWHFSYLGGIDAIRQKLKAFSHIEYATDPWTDPVRIKQAMDEHKDLFDRKKLSYTIVPIDESFPRCVRENQERWKEHICPVPTG